MLELGALYIALYARDTPNDFHWALYHHWSSRRGTKFHIRNIGSSWFAEHVHRDNGGIMKEFLLVGLMKIADVQGPSSEALYKTVSAVPYDYPGVTCRTWVVDALRACMSAGLIGWFSTEEMEKHARVFGSSQFDDTAKNVQPRPITTFEDAGISE